MYYEMQFNQMYLIMIYTHEATIKSVIEIPINETVYFCLHWPILSRGDDTVINIPITYKHGETERTWLWRMSIISVCVLVGYPSIWYPWVVSWWRHQMEAFSALLAICAGNSPVPGEFPAQRPVTRSFDVFFDLRLNKRLSKQSWGWWFETLSHSLRRHRNVNFREENTQHLRLINILIQ